MLKMRNLLLKISILIAVLLGAASLAPLTAYAACDASTTAGAIQCGSCSAAGADCTPAQTSSTVNTTVKTVINILSVVVGAVAVIMVIMAGFRYITSAGDSNKIASAKNTLIYALVGLAIVMLAQLIVQFVINKSTAVANGSSSSSSSGGSGSSNQPPDSRGD